MRAVLLGKRDVIVLIARAEEGPLESRAFAILDELLERRGFLRVSVRRGAIRSEVVIRVDPRVNLVLLGVNPIVN